MGWSNRNADYQVHLRRFTEYASQGWQTEPLYTVLMCFFNTIGASYRMFLVCFAAFFLFVNYKYAKKYTKYIPFVMALYFVFPLCMDATMVRYTLASSVVSIGMISLLDEKDKKWLWKYIVAVIIATAIHGASILAMIFLCIRILDRRKIIAITSTGVLILSAGIGFVQKFSYRLASISFLNLGAKINIALNAARLNYTTYDCMRYIFKMIILFIILSVIYYLICGWERKRGLTAKDNTSVRLIDNIFNMNIIVLLILPLLIISPDLFRIQLYLMFTNYIGFAQYFELKDQIGITVRKGTVTVISVCMVIFAISGLYLWVLGGPNLYTVFKPLFENNALFY